VKFHEYKTLWEEMKGRVSRQVTEEMFYVTAMARGVRAGNGLVLAEGIWKRLRRPYYQVWPAIIPALLNLRLDIQTSPDFHPHAGAGDSAAGRQADR